MGSVSQHPKCHSYDMAPFFVAIQPTIGQRQHTIWPVFAHFAPFLPDLHQPLRGDDNTHVVGKTFRVLWHTPQCTCAPLQGRGPQGGPMGPPCQWPVFYFPHQSPNNTLVGMLEHSGFPTGEVVPHCLPTGPGMWNTPVPHLFLIGCVPIVH